MTRENTFPISCGGNVDEVPCRRVNDFVSLKLLILKLLFSQHHLFGVGTA